MDWDSIDAMWSPVGLSTTAREHRAEAEKSLRRARRVAMEAKRYGGGLSIWKKAGCLMSDQIYGSPLAAQMFADRLRRGLLLDSPDSVYFIERGAGGPIKIGWSGNPTSRLVDLQVGAEVEVSIIATVSGNAMVEAMLHAIFNRDRMRGEWFRRSSELGTFVGMVKNGGRK